MPLYNANSGFHSELLTAVGFTGFFAAEQTINKKRDTGHPSH